MSNQIIDYENAYSTFARSESVDADPTVVESAVSGFMSAQYFSVALVTILLRTFYARERTRDAVVVSATGGTSWAMALRLEHRRGTWLCTTLQVL